MKEFYCTVRGRWTTAISDIDTTCRFYASNVCRKKEACEHKTNNPNARFIGRTVKSITDDSLVFNDGSIFRLARRKA